MSELAKKKKTQNAQVQRLRGFISHKRLNQSSVCRGWWQCV